LGKYKIPFVSSNLNICEGKTCRFLAARQIDIQKGPVKIAIISVTDPDVFALYPEKVTSELTIFPVNDTLSSLIRSNKGKYDLLVLLSHCGNDVDEVLAKNFPEIDVIVGGHSQTLLGAPTRIGKTFIVQAGENAKNVGRLDAEIRRQEQDYFV
jgi:2',3'-cyclic-nucleotide 2'-phosphodiesterase (5'-nucleotidase family)